MQVELRTLQRRLGITTVLVTHDQDEALTMADKIAIMRNGQFEQTGAPSEVYSRPRRVSSRAFSEQLISLMAGWIGCRASRPAFRFQAGRC
jgi:ABC-type Fe3+/spermidine/putrescine transport system ATPase subunit